MPLALLLGAYALYLGTVSLAIAAAPGFGLVWRLPAVIVAYQLGYGLGTWQGALDLVRGRAPSQAVAGLTR